jgi:hypothetical protein
MADIAPFTAPANPNAGRVVKFTNITAKDFSHAFGGQPFFVKAGETVMFPYDLAKHLAKHLARRIFLDADTSPTQYDPQDKTGGAGRALWDDAKEQDMMGKILGDSFTEETMAPKSELEALKEKVDALNKRFNEQGTPAEAVVAAPSQDASVAPQSDVKADVAALGYKDKAEVIAELQKRNIQFDARQTKAKLEALLTT